MNNITSKLNPVRTLDKKHTKLVLFIPIIILLCMLITPLSTLAFGDAVILQTKPVDPRDLFRGDYVVLSYDIEEIRLDKVINLKKDINEYDKLYVVLKEQDGIHIVDYATPNKPKGEIYIKGNIGYWREDSEIIRLDYNINTFFVAENTGRELENQARKGTLVAELRVFGSSVILKDIRPQGVK